MCRLDWPFEIYFGSIATNFGAGRVGGVLTGRFVSALLPCPVAPSIIGIFMDPATIEKSQWVKDGFSLREKWSLLISPCFVLSRLLKLGAFLDHSQTLNATHKSSDAEIQQCIPLVIKP